MNESIENRFIANHFQCDCMNEIDFEMLKNNVLSARKILKNPERFPKANFDYLEKLELEGTCFLLKGPIKYIV